ncbi:MAG TPA: GGDEF domain-containing protein [Candidatus Baltobacteraceae bacterium]
MVQLNTEQLLQVALAISAAAFAIVAAVFLLVLHGTQRRRGLGWFWGWTFLALTFGLLAGSQYAPRLESLLAMLATCAAIACAVAGVMGAYSFRNRPITVAAAVVLALAAAAALLVQWRGDMAEDLVAPEIALAASLLIQAFVLFPIARTARMSGLKTACALQIVLAILTGRTVFFAALLAPRGQAFTELYWLIEAAGGLVLGFLLALGELIALLDEVRIELEDANVALNQALEGLEVAAKLDPLTGLYNRYAFYMLINEFTEKGQLGGSIAIIDLNGLKRINDTFGHHAGDRALLNVAMRLQEVVRQSDYVFRWGGDEFVLLLFGMPPDAARERLTHMRPPAPLELPGHAPMALAMSWGVAPLQPDVDAALSVADAQLYAQKRLLTRAAGRLTTP